VDLQIENCSRADGPVTRALWQRAKATRAKATILSALEVVYPDRRDRGVIESCGRAHHQAAGPATRGLWQRAQSPRAWATVFQTLEVVSRDRRAPRPPRAGGMAERRTLVEDAEWHHIPPGDSRTQRDHGVYLRDRDAQPGHHGASGHAS